MDQVDLACHVIGYLLERNELYRGMSLQQARIIEAQVRSWRGIPTLLVLFTHLLARLAITKQLDEIELRHLWLLILLGQLLDWKNKVYSAILGVLSRHRRK